MESKSFNWENVRSLGIVGILAAFAVPAGIATAGFRLVLPLLVSRGVPVVIAWSGTAAVMLAAFCLFTFIAVKREAGRMGISLTGRMCLKRLSGRETVLAILLSAAAIVLTMAVAPLNGRLIELLGIEVPGYMPHFLNPSAGADSVDLGGSFGNFGVIGRLATVALLALALLLNVFTEEFYFRAWLLPKMSRFGRWAWIWNAAGFTAYHVFQFWLYPIIFIPSLVFSFICYRTKSVWPSLVAHLLLNAMNVVGMAMMLFAG